MVIKTAARNKPNLFSNEKELVLKYANADFMRRIGEDKYMEKRQLLRMSKGCIHKPLSALVLKGSDKLLMTDHADCCSGV